MVRKIWCAPFCSVFARLAPLSRLTHLAAALFSCIGAGYVGGPTMAMIALKWCVRTPGPGARLAAPLA
jgi:hypothetical protein